MVEKATTPSPWTPAPEDTDAAILNIECPELSELVDGQQLTIWLSHNHASSTAESQGITAAELTPTETITQSYSNSWLNLTLADGSKTG